MANNELNSEAKILEAANSIFLQFGYHGTTLQQIATKQMLTKQQFTTTTALKKCCISKWLKMYLA